MEIYIHGSSCISPFDPGNNTMQSVEGRFSCVEPEYGKIMDARQLRRMSRIMRMALATAIGSLDNAGNGNPDAIITATGFGCLEDTGVFLTKISDPDNRAMNPTAFIQSVHNTMSGMIALFLGNTCYNTTFTQGNLSFEHALLDAMMLLQENAAENILLGGIDELTSVKFKLTNRLLLAAKENYGYFGQGEGATFFSLSSKPSKTRISKLLLPKKGDQTEIYGYIDSLINSKEATLVLSGKVGSKADLGYQYVDQFLAGCKTIDYKRYCGDYPTSSAFACWMAFEILNERFHLPGISEIISDVLIHHAYPDSPHSLIHIAKC